MKFSFLIPSSAARRVGANVGLRLSPSPLDPDFAVRSVDAARVEVVVDKTKLEDAGVILNNIAVLGMRDFLPDYAAQLMVRLDSHDSNLYNNPYKEVYKVVATHSKKQLCMQAVSNGCFLSISEGGGGRDFSGHKAGCELSYLNDAADKKEEQQLVMFKLLNKDTRQLLCADTESNYTGAVDTTEVKNKAEAVLDVITVLGADAKMFDKDVLEELCMEAEFDSAGLDLLDKVLLQRVG